MPDNDYMRSSLSSSYNIIKDYDNGLIAAKKAVELDNTSSYNWTQLANSYKYNYDYENALEAIKKAYQLNPYDWLAIQSLAEILTKLGNYEEAIKAYEECYNITNETYFLSDISNIYVQLKDFKNALEIDLKIASIDPEDGIYSRCAFLFSKLSKYDEAEDYALKALNLNNSNPMAWSCLGRVYYYLYKDYKKSLDAYRLSFKNNSQSFFDWGNFARLIYKIEENFEDADFCFKQAIKFKSEPLDILWNDYGIFLIDFGQKYDALNAFSNAVNINPNNLNAKKNLNIVMKEIYNR